MFELADKEDIGRYLAKRIDGSFPSRRQFCKAYLEMGGEMANEDEINKMSNRLSQIIKGRKSVQVYDLPIFVRLLDVSCEEILSAGKCFVPVTTHLTNYAAAFTQNEKDWESYVHREDGIILNADEYGKTVIDYALEFKNYKFLRYLMEKGYIYFVGEDRNEYFYNFGAGTKIAKKTDLWKNINILDVRLNEQRELRRKMIILAVQNDDIEILNKLRAREIPALYQAFTLACRMPELEEDRDEDMIDAVAHASNKVLDYFSEEFEIEDRVQHVNRFLFPYISEVLEVMIREGHEYTERVLKSVISHNQYTYEKLSELFERSVSFYNSWFPDPFYDNDYKRKDIIKSIMRRLDFDEEYDLVRYLHTERKDGIDGILTNIVHVDAQAESCEINQLIEELNSLYERIRSIKPVIDEKR